MDRSGRGARTAALQAADPRRAAAAIGPHTRAILPVHLFGHPADMVASRDLACAWLAWRNGTPPGAGGRKNWDTDVVLDLMVHDLSLLLTLTTAPVKSLQAMGGSFQSPQLDHASAHFSFAMEPLPVATPAGSPHKRCGSSDNRALTYREEHRRLPLLNHRFKVSGRRACHKERLKAPEPGVYAA